MPDTTEICCSSMHTYERRPMLRDVEPLPLAYTSAGSEIRMGGRVRRESQNPLRLFPIDPSMDRHIECLSECAPLPRLRSYLLLWHLRFVRAAKCHGAKGKLLPWAKHLRFSQYVFCLGHSTMLLPQLPPVGRLSADCYVRRPVPCWRASLKHLLWA